MSFLSIDCSTEFGLLFLKIKNKTFIKNLQSDKANNDFLMKHILDFFKENNIKFGDISQIFVNQGPGNFSGLRSSLAVAKGVSLSKNIKLYGYNTFILSCAKYFNKKDSIISLIKFRQKYFIKKFNKNLNGTQKVEETTIEEILKKHKNQFIVIPKSSIKLFDEKILNLSNISVMNLDHNDLKFLKLKGLLNNDSIKPLYLN